MRIDVHHPAFESQQLSVETASVLGVPKLFLGGVAVKGRRGRYQVMSDAGADTLIQLKYNLVDPVPTLKVGEETVRLAPPMEWYEYGWSGLPLLLAFIGGAVGGLVGGVATVTNGRIFRSGRNAVAKYGLSGLVTVFSVAIFLALALALRPLFAPHK